MQIFETFFKILSIFFVSYNISFTQNNTFKINGKISGVNDGDISLVIPSNDSSFQAENKNVAIKNGFFEISGKLQYPRPTRLIINDSITYYSDWFYLENCKQELILKITNNSIIVESNSEVFKENKDTFGKFNDSLMLIKIRCYDILDSLNQEKNSNPNMVDSINFIISNLVNISDAYLLNQIKQNNCSYLALSELHQSIEFGKEKYFSYFELFSTKLKESVLGVKVKNKLRKFNYLNKGSVFPALILLDTSFNLKTLNFVNEDKYTLVDFWFSSCGACVNQFPRLKELYSKYNNVGFQLIGISTELKKSQNEWQNGISKYQLPWPQFWDVDHLQTSEYGIRFFPTNFLLDSNGNILSRNIGLDALSDFLNENLN